jgi:DNA-binding transcriptional LysR family regulator
MELSQLRAFSMVAETLNLTRAAARLNLTQSAVSHQIRSLEAELGEPLFLRTTRGVQLTQTGRAALEHVERLLQEVEALRDRVSVQGRPPSGRVRVAAATQALVHLFGPVFESFARAHADVQLSFRTTASTQQTVADILDGLVDVGFASLPVYSPNLRVVPLFEDELLVVVAKSHRLGSATAATVEGISGERVILFERGASIRQATDRFFNQVGIAPPLALESNDTDFIKLMVGHGVGISLLPWWAVQQEVAAGTLAALSIAGHQLRRSVAMVSLDRFQPSATRAFLEYVLQHQTEIQAAAGPPRDRRQPPDLPDRVDARPPPIQEGRSSRQRERDVHRVPR